MLCHGTNVLENEHEWFEKNLHTLIHILTTSTIIII